MCALKVRRKGSKCLENLLSCFVLIIVFMYLWNLFDWKHFALLCCCCAVSIWLRWSILIIPSWKENDHGYLHCLSSSAILLGIPVSQSTCCAALFFYYIFATALSRARFCSELSKWSWSQGKQWSWRQLNIRETLSFR